MSFEHIEKLKRAFTDKYVVVDATRPELTRFRNATGLVKTVNMSGRALVEFDQYDNTGWYDIELDFLKVVPKPEQKAAEKAAEKPAAAKAAPAAKAPAAAKPQAAGADKPSTADILAAARVKKGSGEPAAPAAKPQAAAKPAGAKLSTKDILAAARGNVAAAPAAKAPAAAKPQAEEPAEEEAAAPAAVAAPAPKPAAAKPAAGGGAKPTTTAEKIAYCQRVDAKS